MAGWWASGVLGRAGRFLLPRTFPRTWRPAAGQLLLLSATRWHEQAFDHRPTALHLYSDHLPYLRWATAWLDEQKTSTPPDPLFGELEAWADQAQARHAISSWTEAASPHHERVANHLKLGNLTSADLDDPARLATVSTELASACLLSDGALVAPYFDLVR
jgi:hypothetical protein